MQTGTMDSTTLLAIGEQIDESLDHLFEVIVNVVARERFDGMEASASVRTSARDIVLLLKGQPLGELFDLWWDDACKERRNIRRKEHLPIWAVAANTL